ncbi:HD domain-containing protein, partial [bacterium]|nr:HD domain-containing protein [bacterium]
DPQYKYSDLAQKEGLSSLISSPLKVNDEAIGAITVYSAQPHKYSRQEEMLFSKVVRQAAIAIENARLYQQLYNAYLQAISSFLTMVEAKDKYTRNHSKRVAEYAVACAKKLNLAPDKVKVLSQACYVYDLGKVEISDHLLVKPGRLTRKEWEIIKEHPLKAADILKPLAYINEIITVVKQHHERFDGSGYPCKEKGEDVLKEARILSVADSYDAMVTDRPYRKALSKEEAITELRRCSGKQFDPEIVAAFILAMKEKEKKG